MKRLNNVWPKGLKSTLLACVFWLLALPGMAQNPVCGNGAYDLASGYVIEKTPSFARQLKIDSHVPTNGLVIWWETLVSQFSQLDNAAFRRAFFNNRIGKNVATPGLEWRYKYEVLAQYADNIHFLINGLYTATEAEPFYDLEAALRKGRDNSWSELHLTASELYYLYSNPELAQKTILYVNRYDDEGNFIETEKLDLKLTDISIANEPNVPPLTNVIPGPPPELIATTPARLLPLREEDGITIYISDGKDNLLNEVYHFELYAVVPAFDLNGVRYEEEQLINPEDGKPYFATNNLGEITIPASLIKQGQQLKVRKLIYKKSVVGQDGVNDREIEEFDNQYRIFVQNSEYSKDGLSLDHDPCQLIDIKLDRTEISYNYLVTVEWDAGSAYIENLQESFKLFNQFMLDYTDGHVRMDTIVIKDNRQDEPFAHMKVHASNIEWASAFAGGMDNPYIQDVNGNIAVINFRARVNFPRKWWGTGLDDQRNQSVLEPYPYDLTGPFQYKTIGHENGHFIFNFYDEYRYYVAPFKHEVYPANAKPDRFGLMEEQWALDSPLPNGVPGSEMSSPATYFGFTGFATAQQGERNGLSCWEDFEIQRQRFYEDNISSSGPNSGKTIWAEILTPEQRINKPDNLHYYPGPIVNQQEKMVFLTFNENTGSNPHYMKVDFKDGQANIKPAEKAKIDIIKGTSTNVIKQGETADANLASRANSILLLGARNGDIIHGEVVENNVATYVGNKFYASTLPDGFQLLLNKVAGQPANNGTNRLAQNNNRVQGLENEPVQDSVFRLVIALNINSSNVELTFKDNSGFVTYNKVTHLSTGTTALFTNNEKVVLPKSIFEQGDGFILIEGVDADGVAFSYLDEYAFYTSFTAKTASSFQSVNGDMNLNISANDGAGLSDLIIYNYAWNLPTNGLPFNATRITDVYSFNATDLSSFNGSLEIIYDETKVDESLVASFAMYKWNAATEAWQIVDGDIEISTERNVIRASVNSMGTYAVFYWDGSVAPPAPNPNRGSINLEQVSTSPNPFKEQFTTSFELGREAVLSIALYNTMGVKIKEVQPYTRMQAGKYALDLEGSGLQPGTYFMVFQFENEERIIKRVLKVE